MAMPFATFHSWLGAATFKGCQLCGDHAWFLWRVTVGQLITLAISSHSCGIKLNQFTCHSFLQIPRTMFHHGVFLGHLFLWSANRLFSFPFSLFHAAPPGGQLLEFVVMTDLSQQKGSPHQRKATLTSDEEKECSRWRDVNLRWKERILNPTYWVYYHGISLLGCGSGKSRGNERRQNIFMTNQNSE